jgi:hypothetical protein
MSLSQQLSALIPQDIREYIDAKVGEEVAALVASQELYRNHLSQSDEILRRELEEMKSQVRAIKHILNV